MIDHKIIAFSPPDISELEIKYVTQAMRSGWITTGAKTKEFEKKISKYINADKTVCLNSATAALELTLRILGIGEGDEVITSAYTYTASCSPICHVGATPVMIDIAPDQIEMDYEALALKITDKTKAIIPVDIAGIVCDYDKLYEIIQKKNSLFRPAGKMQKAIGRIALIADSAHAFGAKRESKMCGEIADFTTFSFHAVKNLTTAEGGSVSWKHFDGIDNQDIYNQYMLLSLHGQNKDALEKTKLGSWEYDIVAPNYKCNMTDIAAAMGLGQLERYDSILKRRKELVQIYDAFFAGTKIKTLNHFTEKVQSSGHLYITRCEGINCEKRNELITALAQKGIIANVHYKPLPMFTAYKNLGFSIDNYPNAYNFFQNEITLPLHTLLTNEDAEYIAKTYLDLVK